MFGQDMVVNSIYVHQQSKHYIEKFPTDDDRLKEAERLVRVYAEANFVVTSRILCALPCLGLGTPVVFINRVNTIEADSCRMNGLLNLFNVVTCNKGKLSAEFATELPITAADAPANKDTWIPLAKGLETTCKEFVLKQENTPPVSPEFVLLVSCAA